MRNVDDFLKNLPLIVESIVNKKLHRLMSKEQLSKLNIFQENMETCTAEQIAEILCEVYNRIPKIGDTTDYYCGITNDIVIRKSTHERDDYGGKEILFVIAIKCKDNETAADVEEIMNQRGFDTGKTNTWNNGGADDSDIVYLYRKPI